MLFMYNSYLIKVMYMELLNQIVFIILDDATGYWATSTFCSCCCRQLYKHPYDESTVSNVMIHFSILRLNVNIMRLEIMFRDFLFVFIVIFQKN